MGLERAKLNYLELRHVGLSLDFSSLVGRAASEPPVQAIELDRVLDEMAALESGVVANPSEGRQVGHYWLRAPELAPNPGMTEVLTTTNTAIQDFCQRLSGRFRDVLHIGIGGSALGPQLLVDSFDGVRHIRFIDNADAETITTQLNALALRDTLVVVVSKSGGTLEVMSALALVKAAFDEEGLPFATHAIALTSPGSKLDRRAADEGWLARFAIPEWVGGRTSIFGAPGLVTLALRGQDINAFLDGAAAMDALTRSRDQDSNPALRLASLWHRASQGGVRTLVFLPYRDRLVRLGAYLQQLIMESIGKAGHGFTVLANKGTTDQHALIQHLRDGTDDSLNTFVEVLEDGGSSREVSPGVRVGDIASAFLAGTREALTEAGRPCLTFTLNRLDLKSFGALIALMERAVGFYASLIGINAYDQPGVEAGKRSAARFLRLQGELLETLTLDTPVTVEALSEALAASVPDIAHLLRHLCANGRVRQIEDGYAAVEG